jgi:hypothetical protein
MTPEEFKDAQVVLGLSNKEMAAKLHYNISMLEHFRSGRVHITDRCAAFVQLLISYQIVCNLLGKEKNVK